MEFVLRHYFPGRVRLYTPSLCRRRALAESTLGWLRKQNSVVTARINYDCSSLVVEYDKAHDGLLRGLIGRLRLLTPDELAARFGVVVSERAAASALPVLGALGGASVTTLFMNHFQPVAHGHFTVRRLERLCGVDAVRVYYESLAADHAADEPRRPLRR
jgi:hypothetical protein